MDALRKSFGQHYLVEFIGCPADKISTVDHVKPLLLRAAELSEATVVGHCFKQYEPYGMTGVILISESHFSIHTWPEEEFVAFDILTCGEMYPERAVDFLAQEFAAREVRRQVIPRGY